ncbi:MAG TPA: VPDSG-CTERM sorting domain-containing protein, partial [Verrucomicrobiae bacterium]|nr:VPDSG-CTERM sorting domain-containing protein [Verrucomicrobiae bacterium]
HRPYDPAPVNNNPDPSGTPPGLQVFNPTPASPGTGSPASVPDGGTTSGLLGIGLVGTAMMKKKFAK